jgi:hypothetical protein
MKMVIRIKAKGQSGVEIPIIGAIALLTIVLTILVPIFFLKIHVTRIVQIEYGYDSSDLALLTLVSDRKIYRDLSLYISGAQDDSTTGFSRSFVEGEVTGRLNELLSSRCFKLYYVDEEKNEDVLLDKMSNIKCDAKYSITTYISLPDGLNRKEIKLMIGEDQP